MFDSLGDSVSDSSRYTSTKSLFNILVKWALDRTPIGSQERKEGKREIFEVVLTDVEGQGLGNSAIYWLCFLPAVKLQGCMFVGFNTCTTIVSKGLIEPFISPAIMYSSCYSAQTHGLPNIQKLTANTVMHSWTLLNIDKYCEAISRHMQATTVSNDLLKFLVLFIVCLRFFYEFFFSQFVKSLCFVSLWCLLNLTIFQHDIHINCIFCRQCCIYPIIVCGSIWIISKSY